MKRLAKFAKYLLVLIGITILFFMLKSVGFSKFLAIIEQSKNSYIVIGVFFYLLSVTVRSYKIFYVVQFLSKRDISFFGFWINYLEISSISTFMPSRSGDVLFLFLIQRTLGSALLTGAGILIFDRMVELVWLVLSNFFALAYLTTGLHANHLTPLTSLLFVAGISIGTFFYILFYSKLLYRLPTKLRQRVNEFLSVRDQLRLCSSRIVFLTGVVWVCDFISLFFFTNSIVSVKFMDNVAAQAIAIFVGIVSMIPAGLGSSNATYAFLLTSLGYTGELVVSSSLFSKLVLMSIALLLGISAYAYKNKAGNEADDSKP
jgi:Predicted integral membrane protein